MVSYQRKGRLREVTQSVLGIAWVLPQVHCTSHTVTLAIKNLNGDILGSQNNRNVLWSTLWVNQKLMYNWSSRDPATPQPELVVPGFPVPNTLSLLIGRLCIGGVG